MNKELYFAYGSNMDLDQMNIRIPRQFDTLGVGKLSDWEWRINLRGYANIIPNKGSEVYGVLFSLSRDGLRSLDRYEGYPKLYTRKKLDIIHGDNTTRPWVYIDTNSIQKGLPREGYLERVITSAMNFKLPHQYISRLANFLPY